MITLNEEEVSVNLNLKFNNENSETSEDDSESSGEDEEKARIKRKEKKFAVEVSDGPFAKGTNYRPYSNTSRLISKLVRYADELHRRLLHLHKNNSDKRVCASFKTSRLPKLIELLSNLKDTNIEDHFLKQKLKKLLHYYADDLDKLETYYMMRIRLRTISMTGEIGTYGLKCQHHASLATRRLWRADFLMSNREFWTVGKSIPNESFYKEKSLSGVRAALAEMSELGTYANDQIGQRVKHWRRPAKVKEIIEKSKLTYGDYIIWEENLAFIRRSLLDFSKKDYKKLPEAVLFKNWTSKKETRHLGFI